MSDFKIKGFHLDLRVQVMQMPALHQLADTLAAKGFNTLIIEWEASFPFAHHTTISNRFAYKPEEVRDFIQYCINLGIDVIPLQQCFGHVEYILRHPRYAHLREDPVDLCQLCPCKADAAIPLFREIFQDVIDLHPSPYFHIGGDETYLLGKCPECQKIVNEHSKSFLYVTYLHKLIALVQELGKIPVLWADIILKHPESAHLLPRDAIFVDWNYGWAFDRFGDSAPLRKQGFHFWGAAALRSNPDNYWLTCWDRHLRNFRDFIPFARQSDYEGMILTSWSTSGAYGYFSDSEDDVAEILPQRRVYPLSGFNMLLTAFSEAVGQSEPLQPDVFLMDYARRHFGLSESDCTFFRDTFLRKRQHLSTEGFSADEREQIVLEAARFQDIRPAANNAEWNHLQLMLKLEALQARFLHIFSLAQAPDFHHHHRKELASQLLPIMHEADIIDTWFQELQAGYLFDAEIQTEIQYRRYRLNDLHARLSS